LLHSEAADAESLCNAQKRGRLSKNRAEAAARIRDPRPIKENFTKQMNSLLGDWRIARP
jgi:hypothetical protein